MSAPVSVDLTESEEWLAFVLSGVTGGSAAFNGTFIYSGREAFHSSQVYRKAGTAHYAYRDELTGWNFSDDASLLMVQSSVGSFAYPWDVPLWDTGDLGGPYDLTFTRTISGPFVGAVPQSSTVQASLTTSLTGTNNDSVFTSQASGPSGRLGNLVTVRYVSPGTNNATLSVVVVGFAITVNLATNGSAAITTTAAQIKTAIEASPDASALVTVANAAGNNGSGVVTALAATALSGGTGGRPLPPVSASL